ncbi:primase-helicase family protein [Pseudophaeobacter arcticus]|uniref:primase-helicase family protein n=1 Tax=Pseudophaeobacter arcticus TaxID=385492 RepID=UPI003A96A70E
MSRREDESTPGSGTEAGGAGKYDKSHSNIIPETIPDVVSEADQKDLSPVGRTSDAVQFLQAWAEGGPWVLTAIVPDSGKITTTTFESGQHADMRDWIEKRQGKWNLYFTVNPVMRPMGSKPKKTDVRGMAWLHVDVDPRPGEDFASERERAEKVLREFGPAPTVIIDSGGGYQGFWMLDKEHETNGDEAKAAELEAYNLNIETMLQGDACHNIDRIMRLPGTINVPGKKKREKGRKAALAKIVDVDWARVYPLSAFKAAEKLGVQNVPLSKVNLSANLPQVALDDLPPTVSSRTKMLIVNGGDPDDPAKYPSRSEVLFAVLCEMVRADVPDDVIAACVMDRDHAISAHVLDQPRPQQYVTRQIRRAHEQAIDPKLRELNDLHAVLSNQDGKCRVLEFVEMPTGKRGMTRLVPSLQSFEDVRNRYLNQRVVVGQDNNGNERFMPLGKWWLENPLRRQFHSLTFQPKAGEVVGEGAKRKLNLWQGFAVKPEPGDWHLMKGHIHDVLAGGDAKLAAYIERWMAWTFQNPDEPAEVALVFRGEPGTGKGVFGRAMAQIFGQHGLHTGGSELITGRFNLHFRDCCLLFADEVIWDGDRKAEAKIKTFLTEPTLTIEGKGKDAVSWPNMLHVVISSNSDWIVPAGPYERRYAVFDVSGAHRQEKAYFKPLYAEIDGAGLAAMLYDLLAMDLGDWHPRDDRPDTAALEDQRARGLDPVKAAVLDMLREGSLPFEAGSDPRGTEARPFIATNEFRDAIQRQTRGAVTANAVSDALKQIEAEKSRKGRPSGYVLQTLGEARAAWNARPELPTQEWDDVLDWTGGEPF